MGKQGRTISPEIRAKAELMYTFENRTLTHISKLLGMTRNTLGKWRRADKWDDRRRSRMFSGPELAQRYRENMQQLMDQVEKEGRILTGGELDGISKLERVVNSLDGTKHFKSNAIKTMDLFNQHVSKIDKDLQTRLAPIIVEFIRETTAE